MLWIIRRVILITTVNLLLIITACSALPETIETGEVKATNTASRELPTQPASSETPSPELVETRQSLQLWTSTPPVILTPLPARQVRSSIEAIQLIQTIFPEVSGIRLILTPRPFDTDKISVFERGDRWDIVFSHGEGDCQMGCINNYYWYYRVWPDGRATKEGEFSRVFDSPTNSYIESGAPQWGIPR